jgi:hypothetical protein
MRANQRKDAIIHEQLRGPFDELALDAALTPVAES